MTVTPTKDQIAAALLNGFGRKRLRKVVDLCRSKGGKATADLVLAIANRESNNQNIVGDGGHGRGAWQIDDRWNGALLSKLHGAISGTWALTLTKASNPGYVPGLIAGLRWCRYIISQNYKYALREGVPQDQAVRVAVAGYNCGPYYAVKGWKEYGDPDWYTTGKDYSKDVMKRRNMVHAILSEWKLNG